jgi:hypothetical protein
MNGCYRPVADTPVSSASLKTISNPGTKPVILSFIALIA